MKLIKITIILFLFTPMLTVAAPGDPVFPKSYDNDRPLADAVIYGSSTTVDCSVFEGLDEDFNPLFKSLKASLLGGNAAPGRAHPNEGSN